MAATARVITAAAAIITVVFPASLSGAEVFLKLMGPGMAAAILVDATIVRPVLVPAVMAIVGPASCWLPDWPARRLPDRGGARPSALRLAYPGFPSGFPSFPPERPGGRPPMSETEPQRPETLCLHGGQEVDPATKARAVPIYQTTSYVFDDTQHAADLFGLRVPGNIYTRIMNPTWDVLEKRIAALEGGLAAMATASGQAAVTYSILNVCRSGDNIAAISTLYGGTYNLFAHTLPQYGIEVRFVDPDDPAGLAGRVDERTRLVFAETIGNPRVNVVDLGAWSEAAHASSTTPCLRRCSAGRSTTAPTWSSTRSPSSSGATAPRSAG